MEAVADHLVKVINMLLMEIFIYLLTDHQRLVILLWVGVRVHRQHQHPIHLVNGGVLIMLIIILYMLYGKKIKYHQHLLILHQLVESKNQEQKLH